MLRIEQKGTVCGANKENAEEELMEVAVGGN